MAERESNRVCNGRPPLVKQLLQLPGMDYIAYQLSRRRLEAMMSPERHYEDAIATAYDYSGFGFYDNIGPMQVRSELSRLHGVLEDRTIETVVEIGVSDGGSLYTFCRGLDDVEKVVGVDLPGGEYGGGYPPEKAKFFDLFMDGDEPTLIRGNSHDESTKQQLVRALDGRAVDLLFIDGDHTYAGVKQDYDMYEPLVRDEGIIAMDDIHTHQREYFDSQSMGVHELWTELETEHETDEIVDESTREKGIGIVYK